MHIKSVDIQNFRKLASVRVDFSETTTLLVGANNSGKTSALAALKKFLIDGASGFAITDLTLSNWKPLNDIGAHWESSEEHDVEALSSSSINSIMPMLDLWLEVGEAEIHRVSALLPSLSWEGNLVGVRVALEAKDIQEIYREYRTERKRSLEASMVREGGEPRNVNLWPTNLTDFLSRRLNKFFELRYYALDPSHRNSAVSINQRPQNLDVQSNSLSSNPIHSLIRIDLISAQRGFSDSSEKTSSSDDLSGRQDNGRLSHQLSGYYKRHLDPNTMPSGKDIEAIQVISEAQQVFDQRLKEAFSEALKEVEGLGYPGISDPKIWISSKLNAEQSLAHESAVSFLIDMDGDGKEELYLPETHNGLGYQNLISMIFKLMSFRDRWLRVGKEGLREHVNDIEPIHLVLVEEPEAHLHVQVQQVFAQKAYGVLCKNDGSEDDRKALTTQLIMSTHSSHVSHELPFAKLRYFHRLHAGMGCNVPTSHVVSLATVFGDKDETNKFVSRYLRANHSDLFFADAVIIVEGNAERMLLPNLIRNEKSLAVLNSSFITILEVNGSHAHRLRNLIETLKIPTLIVTDVDPVNVEQKRISEMVKLGTGQVTANYSLIKWGEFPEQIDDLLPLSREEKIKYMDEIGSPFRIRFAYQTEIEIGKENSGRPFSVYPTTFEDALALENPIFFSSLEGKGLTKEFRQAFPDGKITDHTAKNLFEALRKGGKSELMLDILSADKFSELKIPSYIYEGLEELQQVVSNRLNSMNQGATSKGEQ